VKIYFFGGKKDLELTTYDEVHVFYEGSNELFVSD